MTTRMPDDQIPPFHVESELLKKVNDAGPRTSENHAPAPGGGPGELRPFQDLDLTWTQALAGPVLAVIYFVTQQRPDLAPVTILVLLGATLYRLDKVKRRIAAVPITFAALRLASNLVEAGLRPAANYFGRPNGISIADCGLSWIPLFFAICLIYMPKYPTATGKIFLATSTLLLTSGLLPAESSLGIFATCQYFLFIGVVVGLILDFTGHYTVQPHPTAPLGAAPLGVTR